MLTEHATSGGARLGGARADFVASLGRKIVDLRKALEKVRAAAEDVPRREELRRKLHALASGAKMMKFDAMERAVAEAIGLIDRTAIDAALEELDIERIEQVLDDCPALAWGETPARLASPTPAPVETALSEEPPQATEAESGVREAAPVVQPEAAATPTFTALVVGPPRIADALLEATDEHPTFACECTPDAQAAFDLARSNDPDIIVLDGDLECALELVEALMDDSATERTPIVVVASFEEAGSEGHFLALGVARTITKPTSREALRAACEETLAPVAPKDAPAVIEMPAAVPENHALVSSHTRIRGDANDVRLHGRRILVVDDDPAVVWFMADTLKAAGCTVYEAFDGEQALEAAYRTTPDLVISDILMPKIDGLSLCRAIRRDVALRDVPVILLSWKEDLLQRARELGAGAAGYLRKETDTTAVLSRCREALRARSRIEGRLLEDGEVRGRLDGVSVRTLLEIVCATRPEARVTVRDATFVYEVEVRFGAPHRAIRTAGDGTSLRGTKVLAAMLGVGAARFTVTPSLAEIEPELDGNLAAQLAKPIARARAATALLTGSSMMTVEKVIFDEAALEEYLRATPDPARTVTRKMADGMMPRAIVLGGSGGAALIEDILADLSSRGVVVGIEGEGGADALGPAVAKLLEKGDARAAFAPRSPTPAPPGQEADSGAEMKPEDFGDEIVPASPETCSVDPGPVCESPMPPRDMSPGGMEAVLQEVAFRSPTPMPMSLAEGSTVKHEEPEPTPSHSQLIALAEPTIVDNTSYGPIEGDEPESDDEDEIAVDEASKPMMMSDEEREQRLAKTPLTTVTTSEPPRPAAPKRSRSLSMVAFVAACAGAVWAFAHFAGNEPKAPPAAEVAPPPAVTQLPPPKSEEVYYSSIATGTDVPAGHGVLDVAAPADATVVVDGTERGHGGATIPVTEGKHEIRVKKAQAPTTTTTSSSSAGDDMCTVEVRAGKVAHKRF